MTSRFHNSNNKNYCPSNHKNNNNNNIVQSKIITEAGGMEDCCTEEESSAAQFLNRYAEDSNLNQYWYSESTIQVYCNVIMEAISTTKVKRVAFLSTPSLYFALPPHTRANSFLFDVSGISNKMCLDLLFGILQKKRWL
jgi:hypothetical protein